MEDKKLEVLMQSKNLVETSYSVTAVQNRVFYYCLFSAQKEKTGELYCTVKLDNIKKLIPNPNQRTLTNIRKMFKVFKNTSLLFDKEDNGDLIECDYNLIAGSEYNTNKQEFKIFFMERLYNHILSYRNYAPLNLEIMSKYTSFYAQRLYEALRMWSRTEQTITHTFTVDTLRFIMGVGDKYPEYKNFKQRVLNQALKEINEMGNMRVDIEEKKEGKKVTKIEFTVYDNEPKTYFKKDEIEIHRETEKEKDQYVNLTDGEFFNAKTRKLFIQYCYDEGISFNDDMGDIYNAAKEVFIYKKNTDKITTLSDYKYFIGIFNNKLKDDIERFAMLSLCR